MPTAPPALSAPVLDESEVGRRMLLLAELRSSLAELGVRSVVARNHRLVLRYNQVPLEPSGLTNPRLHIFCRSAARTAVTDGMSYRLDSGEEFPASDPAAAAVHLACLPQTAAKPA
jgi:hypothetical protein